MSESETSLLKQAFTYSDECAMDMNNVSQCLQQALTTLPESATELREEVTQAYIETENLIDRWGTLSYDIFHLHIKEQALGSTSGFPPEVDALLNVFTRIEARRQSKKRTQKDE